MYTLPRLNCRVYAEQALVVVILRVLIRSYERVYGHTEFVLRKCMRNVSISSTRLMKSI